MNKILINFAHPAKSSSKINKALLEKIKNIEGVTINDLYAKYPDFFIDTKGEQKLCEEHDVIIMQYPFYWYQPPSIVKEWLDTVLKHGWAYGSKGRALEGKHFLQVITAGGAGSTYQRGGSNHFTINELCAPYRATANLCKMTWLPPFSVLGIHRGLSPEELKMHSDNYCRTILALRDGTLDIEKASQEEFLCSRSNIDALIRRD